MRRWLRFVTAVAWVLPGCQPEEAPAPNQPPSVVWIVLDAARASDFGIYGSSVPATPHIDQFAEGATVFERAYCQVPWTFGSAASYLTGLYPWKRLGYVAEGQNLAHHLRAAGWRTAAFSENPYVTAEFGFADGFQTFDASFPHSVLETSGLDYPPVETGRTIDAAIQWVQKQDAAPSFLYVHLLPPHAPYSPPAPYSGRFDPDYDGPVDGSPDTLDAVNRGRVKLTARDLEHLHQRYRENLAFADAEVGRLLDTIDASVRRESMLVIIAADHGEGFLEHGFLLHNYSLYDEVLRVPLVIRFPASRLTAPARVDGVVELREIFGMICRMFEIASCQRKEDGLLSTLRLDAEAAGRAYAISSTPRGKPRIGVVTPGWKLELDGRNRSPLALYDLTRDPGERYDARRDHPGTVKRLQADLRAHPLDRVVLKPLTPASEVREQLRALGYTE